MVDKTPYFNGKVLFNGIAISYLFMLCGSSIWISGLIGMVLGVIILLVFKNNESKISKVCSGLIISLLALTILVNMAHSLYLKNTPILLLTIIPVLAVAIISNTKTLAFKKVVNVLFIYSLFLFILEVAGLYPSIKLANLYPLKIDWKNIIFGSIIFAITSVTPIITLNNTDDKKNIITYYLVSSITIQMIAFLALTVLGQKEAVLFRFPETVVMKRIEFLNFISSVDAFFNFSVIVDIMLTISKGLKNIEEATSKKVKYLSLLVILVIVVWSCYKHWLLLLMYEYFPYILIILLILAIIPIKRRYKKQE